MVSLIIAAMGIVAISHLIYGATRAESAAQAMEKAAMLADHAVDCAVLQGNLFAEAEARPLAQAAGWSLTISTTTVVSGRIRRNPCCCRW